MVMTKFSRKDLHFFIEDYFFVKDRNQLVKTLKTLKKKSIWKPEHLRAALTYLRARAPLSNWEVSTSGSPALDLRCERVRDRRSSLFREKILEFDFTGIFLFECNETTAKLLLVSC